MSDEIRILFVDDEEAIRLSVPEDLQSRLADEHGVACTIEAVETVEDVEEHLAAETYHLLIIDLRLSGDEGGNQIIERILGTQVLPLIVYSGYAQDLEGEYSSHGLIESYQKDDDEQLSQMAGKIAEWKQLRVLDFFSERGLLGSVLRKAMVRTMWENVSMYWEHFPVSDADALERTAVRLAATLVHDEYMSRPEFVGVAGEVPIHHGEMYVLRTPRPYLARGDVLEEKGIFHVVMSPSCDLVPRDDAKADGVLLATCDDLIGYLKAKNLTQKLEDLTAAEDAKRDKAEKFFGKMMRHSLGNQDGRQFFLPPFATFPGGVIDFSRLTTRDYDAEARQSLVKTRVLALNREFAAEVGSRFVRYMMRFGQPTYDEGSLARAVQVLGQEAGSTEAE